MTALLPAVAAALGTFAVTNVDDMVVLTALFATSGRGGATRRQVVAGQYLGMIVIIAVSVIVAVGLLTVRERYVGLLGLVPIALGLRGLRVARRGEGGDEVPAPAVPVRGTLGVAGVTIANGADNLSVYTPLFRQAGVGTAVIYIIVFLVLVALWCGAGALLAGRQAVIAIVDRVGHWLVPCVFVAIGIVIVFSSGLLG